MENQVKTKMMEQNKISIIIPIYCVEEFLCQCLDSVISQTYRNLEIILVDDGSPDRCGLICDEYAAKDSRIIVIHKENGGVSSARNEGLKAATGEWIGWVDPDDWIEPNMFEYLLNGANQYKAQIVVCGRHDVLGKEKKTYQWDSVKCFSPEQALKELLEDKLMRNYLWDKLWKRALFDEIYFPQGRTFEDIAVVAELMDKADQIICLPEPMYYYRQRTGSIVSSCSFINRANRYYAECERREKLIRKYPCFAERLTTLCVCSVAAAWPYYYGISIKQQRQYLPTVFEMSQLVRNNYRVARKNSGLGITGKVSMFLARYPKKWSFAIAYMLQIFYRQIKK